jgi:alpha-methylacyl-CoA racemase
MTQPLAGLLVVDFSTLLPGPLASLMLAEAGAEVIKIEQPGGEEMRHRNPRWDGESAGFTLLNRGKKSLVLDLKKAADHERLMPLVTRADVLIEQFRPGVMQRLGLDYPALREKNARLIYCSITGYGQQGARAAEAGHDINYIGQTGLLALQPGPADQPVVPPALIADIGGGTFPALINILLALRARDATGQGCHIDIAMTDAMFTFAWYGLAVAFATGRYPAAGELYFAGASPRYQLYPTKDGRLVACGALEQKFWLAFTNAIGLAADLIEDRHDPAATKAAVAALVAQRTAEDWRPILAAADCCATVVQSLEEAVRDPHFIARGLFAHQIAGSTNETMPALPLPISPAFRPAPKAISAPRLGADQAILDQAEARAPRHA